MTTIAIGVSMFLAGVIVSIALSGNARVTRDMDKLSERIERLTIKVAQIEARTLGPGRKHCDEKERK